MKTTITVLGNNRRTPLVPRLACPTVSFCGRSHGWAGQPWHGLQVLKSLLSTAVMLAAGTCLAADAKSPNFVFILGEGQGWSSTSVQMDDTNPESRSNYFRT